MKLIWFLYLWILCDVIPLGKMTLCEQYYVQMKLPFRMEIGGFEYSEWKCCRNSESVTKRETRDF